MPPRKPIPSLEELCWKTAVHQFSSFKDLRRQAEYLPTFFIDKLYKRLSKEGYFVSGHLPTKLFLHPNATDWLNFTFDSIPGTENVKKISRDCKNLRRIILPSYSTWAPPESLLTITVNNPLLIHLDLNRTKQFTNNYLIQISKHCPQLQYLNLQDVEDITDDCAHHLPRTLAFLNIENTGITPNGCIIALKRLKCLKELEHHLWIEILKLLTQIRPPKPVFSIECLKVCCEFNQNINLGRIILNTFPNLCEIRLVGSNIDDFESLRENHKLNLITRLDIDLSFQDIFLIGNLCPMLEKLVVGFPWFSERLDINDAMLVVGDHVPFKLLRKLTVRFWYDHFRLADFKLLMASVKSLKSLQIKEWQQLEDRVIYDVLESNLLQGIESIDFYRCGPFTTASLIKMLGSIDSLRFMKISYCVNISDDDMTTLHELIYAENWDVSLSHACSFRRG